MRLAFAGQARSGKDTAIDFLMTKVSKPIKLHVASGVYSTARFMLSQLVIDNTDPKMRKLLQDIGSAGRTYSEDFWVCKLVEDIGMAEYQGYENIFVTGIRYPNEIAKLHELGFRVIYVSRNIGSRLDEGASHTNHHSETSISASDFDQKDMIVNNGTLEEFQDKLMRL
jgi:hypothetical protein